MTLLPQFIERYYHIRKESIAELEEEHDPWGFTIYRTYYGPDSDDQWSKLLQKISDGVKEGLNQLDEAEHYPHAVTKLQALFRLDARSTPDTLDGLTLDEVRRVYPEVIGSRLMNRINTPWRVFLFADAEILQDPDLRLLKVVGGDYDPAAVHRNTRVRKEYFGWITMPATAVVDLYHLLDLFPLRMLAGHAKGGPGAFWDPWDHY